MERFPFPLRVELESDRSTWCLLEPFAYVDPEHGYIDVPAGDKTDFASVRPLRSMAVGLLAVGLLVGLVWPLTGSLLILAGLGLLALYAAVVGYGVEASTLHDRLYRKPILSRSAADAVFYNALRSTGHARWRARFMWLGVRLGGWTRFKK